MTFKLCTTCTAPGHLKVEYDASSWISNPTLENLEGSQCYVGRSITGQLCTTPVEAILVEANLLSIKTQAIQLNTIVIEKLLKTAVTNLRHTTATQQVRQRTKKPNWCEKAVMCGEKSVMPSPPQHPHRLIPVQRKSSWFSESGDTAGDYYPRASTTKEDKRWTTGWKACSCKGRTKSPSISRLKSDHHPDQKYWLHKIGRVLDTVCRKCGMGKETVEHTMGECPRFHQPSYPNPTCLTL